MDYFHGARGKIGGEGSSAPIVADSGITVVVGTTPSHTLEEKTEAMLVNSFPEAKEKFGYSDNWKKYTACEAMYAFFKVHEAAPIVIISVSGKAAGEHKGEAANILNKKFTLPFETVRSTLKVYTQKDGTLLTENTDYILEYKDSGLEVSVLEESEIASVQSCYVEYDLVGEVTTEDIIGSYDSVRGKATGLEMIDYIFPELGIVPDIIIAPGFSHIAEVAAVMSAKCDKITTVFKGGAAYVDIDSSNVNTADKAIAAKKTAGITAANQYALWPMGKIGDRIFHLSTVAAALTAVHDREIGAPSESPSNLPLKIVETCTAGGEKITLTMDGANHLNANGIATALSFRGILRLWGNNTAAYPEETDTKEYLINKRRVLRWIHNTLILTHWERVDRNQNRRLIDNVIDNTNIWLNGLGSEIIAPGSYVEINTEGTDIERGISTYTVHVGAYAPNEQMNFEVVYDAELVSAALGI